jgi:hypothetical protein
MENKDTGYLCIYCLNNFTRKSNLKIHQSKSKCKNLILEKENNEKDKSEFINKINNLEKDKLDLLNK